MEHKECTWHVSKVAVQLFLNRHWDINSKNLFFPLLTPDRRGTRPFYFAACLKSYAFFNKNSVGHLTIEITDPSYRAVFAAFRESVEGAPNDSNTYNLVCAAQQVRMKLIMGFTVECDIQIYVAAIPGIFIYGEVPSFCCRCPPPRVDQQTILPVHLEHPYTPEFITATPVKKMTFVALYISLKKKNAFSTQSIKRPILPASDERPWSADFDNQQPSVKRMRSEDSDFQMFDDDDDDDDTWTDFNLMEWMREFMGSQPFDLIEFLELKSSPAFDLINYIYT